MNEAGLRLPFHTFQIHVCRCSPADALFAGIYLPQVICESKAREFSRVCIFPHSSRRAGTASAGSH